MNIRETWLLLATVFGVIVLSGVIFVSAYLTTFACLGFFEIDPSQRRSVSIGVGIPTWLIGLFLCSFAENIGFPPLVWLSRIPEVVCRGLVPKSLLKKVTDSQGEEGGSKKTKEMPVKSKPPEF